jgi:hypothetical protein
VQIGHISSFFRVFLSTRSSVSRKEGGKPPRLFDSEGTVIQSDGSTGRKFKAESGMCVGIGIGNPVGGGLCLFVSLRLRKDVYSFRDSRKDRMRDARVDDDSGSVTGGRVDSSARWPSISNISIPRHREVVRAYHCM